MRRAAGAVLIVFATGCLSASTAAGQIPAFPGAEGFGAFAQGGRGGDVLSVTTLEDYGPEEAPVPGSLRAAVEREGPRTIVFRVSGHIDLVRVLEIRNPYLTIAGQTAPGEGISVRNFGIDVAAPDVILRYLRVRPGDGSGEEVDAINIRSSNVIVDHCSASWATDETVSVIGDATNVTVQWSLIAESLNESVHGKGEHGYGSLISTAGSVSFHHNVYALHKSRSPRPRDALLDFRNNVVYGWSDRAGYNEDDRTRMNYVGNVLLPLDYSSNDDYGFIVGGSDARFYVDGNVLRQLDGSVRRDWDLIRPPEGISAQAAPTLIGVDRPFASPSVATHRAEDVLEILLDEAGATRPRRDAVDGRIVRLLQDRAGAIVDSQEEVGGWPRLGSGPLAADDDGDGMGDRWEERFGLDPGDASDHAADGDGDGYTNLEEYLNATDPNRAFGWLEPPRIIPGNGTAFTAPPLVVTMKAAEPGVPIYYTTDGREPTRSSTRYEGPVRLPDAAHVRARSIVQGRPTAAAFAAYERLHWLPPRRPATQLEAGLRYAVYEAADWDEGVVLEELEPVRQGTTSGVDFSVRPPAGNNAVVFDGWLEVPRDGIYRLFLSDDLRSVLYVDDILVTQGRPPGAEPGQVALRRGLHAFHVRSLHEEPREAVLEWSGPEIDRVPIDPAHFRYSLP